jgi:hypothetical protein
MTRQFARSSNRGELLRDGLPSPGAVWHLRQGFILPQTGWHTVFAQGRYLSMVIVLSPGSLAKPTQVLPAYLQKKPGQQRQALDVRMEALRQLT